MATNKPTVHPNAPAPMRAMDFEEFSTAELEARGKKANKWDAAIAAAEVTLDILRSLKAHGLTDNDAILRTSQRVVMEAISEAFKAADA